MSQLTEVIGDFSVRPYEFLRQESTCYLNAREREEKKQACDKAYQDFDALRGCIIGKAIALEVLVAWVIAYYFCPVIRSSPDGRETAIELFGPDTVRHQEFLDRILLKPTCPFREKRRILGEILKGLGDASCATAAQVLASEQSLMNALGAVVDIRNRFAHSYVGIDIDTYAAYLLDIKQDKWIPPATYVDSYEQSCATAQAELERAGSVVLHLPMDHDRNVVRF